MTLLAKYTYSDPNHVFFPDRRQSRRGTLVLRVGLLEGAEYKMFCLVRNISARGVQVRVHGNLPLGMPLALRVGDDDPIPAQVVWAQSGLAGLSFYKALAPETLMRVAGRTDPERRRQSPRVEVKVRALLRTGGQTFACDVQDVSTTGAKIFTAQALTYTGPAILEVRGMPPRHCFVRWIDGLEVGLSFVMPLPIKTISEWLRQGARASAI